MATKKQTAVVKQEAAVVPTVGGVTPMPDWIERNSTETGAEHIRPEDVRMPRLLLAQGLSPQVLKGDPAFIQGLTVGDAFNDLTGEIYGSDPLSVLIVRADPPRWVEFDPDDRKVILDRDVPYGDPRTQWTEDEDGDRKKPAAVQFFDYVLLVGDGLEPMAFSYKSTGVGQAKRLNGLLKMRPGVPIYAFRYKLVPTQMKNDQGTWYIFAVQPGGVLTDKAVYDAARDVFQQVKNKDVTFDRGVADAPLVAEEAPAGEM